MDRNEHYICIEAIKGIPGSSGAVPAAVNPNGSKALGHCRNVGRRFGGESQKTYRSTYYSCFRDQKLEWRFATSPKNPESIIVEFTATESVAGLNKH